MSSDGYFDDDDQFDAAALEQLDAIEAAYTSSKSAIQTCSPATSTSRHIQPSVSKPVHIIEEDSFYDLTLDLDEAELEKLDGFIVDSIAGKAKPIGPTRQTTLFGGVVQQTHHNQASGTTSLQKTTSSPRNPFGQKPKKTKIWDQTAFAKSGRKQKGKGKGKATGNGEGDEGLEEVEFEQFPAPSMAPIGPPPSMKLQPDLLEAKHWIYPLNKPKRDYQYNIVKHSLFENTIISVPTGLGKTFIAGVIMLNYYRWFPEGKLVFLAPTKPLAAQQIEACHQTSGIPGGDATLMTGEVIRAKRERLWTEKRVFYMTPQVFINDLTSQICDVMDVVLIIIDEAHKATGDYAYSQVVRWMMAKNPHFRLIALTATPGSNPMAVQNLVDALHISHIEIRDENSIDLRPYLNEKKIEQHCIRMPEGISIIKDRLVELMDSFLNPLKARGVMLPGHFSAKLHPYAARVKMNSLPPQFKGYFGQLSILGNLAQAMGYLLEGTASMAYKYIKEIATKDADDQASSFGKTQSKKLRENPLYQKVLAAFEGHKISATSLFPPHPKMDKTVNILVDYYGQRLPSSDQEEEGESSPESKAMVFVTHREAVDELVETLNVHSPMIRASKFIGQGTDKQGKRGQAQKEQLEIIQKFQAKDFNVLVATCIGEEGLDIGEVDLIICYDTQKTPIRMLQRFGRTGRKRSGCVHVLLAEEREEFNLDKARAAYKEVQKSILRGGNLEFYADVERLLPDHIRPSCLEKKMDIEPYVREERRKAVTRSPKKPAASKRKRNEDMLRNIPEGASTGFVSVADLIIKGSKKRKVSEPKDLDAQGEDDDIDKELESGVYGTIQNTRRTQSMVAPRAEPNKKPKGRLKKAATIATGSAGGKKTTQKKGKAKAKAKVEISIPSLSQAGRDDSVDRELDQGPWAGFIKSSRITNLSPSPSPSTSPDHPPTHPLKSVKPAFSPSPVRKLCSVSPLNTPTRRSNTNLNTPSPDYNVVMELTDRETEPNQSSPVSWPRNHDGDKSMAWLVDDDDDEPNIQILSSSPILPPNAGYDESVEIVAFRPSNPQKREKSNSQDKPQRRTIDLDVLELSSEPDFLDKLSSSSPETKAQTAMPPPIRIPQSSRAQLTPKTPGIQETQPIRQFGKKTTRRLFLTDSSDNEDMAPPLPRRLRRYGSSPCSPDPSPQPQQRTKKKRLARKDNALLDYAAEHSGDDVSEGSSRSEDDEENEEDRAFIKDSPFTQASPSYNQTAAYRKGLMTQAPGAPAFTKAPIRNKPFGRIEPRVHRHVVDSSPPPEDDQYEFGSFVVDNDAEISYMTQAGGIDDSF